MSQNGHKQTVVGVGGGAIKREWRLVVRIVQLFRAPAEWMLASKRNFVVGVTSIESVAAFVGFAPDIWTSQLSYAQVVRRVPLFIVAVVLLCYLSALVAWHLWGAYGAWRGSTRTRPPE